jgi:hypothetical protein
VPCTYPIDRDPSLLKELAYWGKHILPGSRYLWNVLQGKSISEPLMQINSYSIRALYEAIESAGIQEIWLLPLKGSLTPSSVSAERDLSKVNDIRVAMERSDSWQVFW